MFVSSYMAQTRILGATVPYRGHYQHSSVQISVTAPDFGFGQSPLEHCIELPQENRRRHPSAVPFIEGLELGLRTGGRGGGEGRRAYFYETT